MADWVRAAVSAAELAPNVLYFLLYMCNVTILYCALYMYICM